MWMEWGRQLILSLYRQLHETYVCTYTVCTVLVHFRTVRKRWRSKSCLLIRWTTHKNIRLYSYTCLFYDDHTMILSTKNVNNFFGHATLKPGFGQSLTNRQKPLTPKRGFYYSQLATFCNDDSTRYLSFSHLFFFFVPGSPSLPSSRSQLCRSWVPPSPPSGWSAFLLNSTDLIYLHYKIILCMSKTTPPHYDRHPSTIRSLYSLATQGNPTGTVSSVRKVPFCVCSSSPNEPEF
jgi:hypothetical protein